MKTKHNHLGLMPGDIVILDEEFNNASEVEILNLSKPEGMFAQIRSRVDGDVWEVMTSRLSKKY